MKKQKNILNLFLALIPCMQATYITAEAFNGSSSFQAHDEMPMPSVEELFGNMTEEQIVQQIQEAQKLFESLSPEEMEEFAKIVDETWSKMAPSDKEAIQDIASMVKPYFPPEQEEAPEQKPLEKEEPAKPKKIIIENNSVQTLIDNINAQIDDVLQKISSNKDLIEEFSAKWTSRITFDNLKRQILALKEDRLANKLIAKTNSEDKELVEALESFYKDVKNKNESFYVEDTFGLPSSSKSQDAKQLKQAKAILAIFDLGISELMPKIELFLKKHAPEALEMAKESAERAKQAQALAKDATVKRGSAAAPLAPNTSRKTSSSQQQSPVNNAVSYNQAYYDPYASYGGGYGGYNDYGNYGSGYNDYPAAQAPQADTATKKDQPKKEEPKKEEKEKDESNKKKELTPYNQAIDEIEGYFDVFDNKAHQKLLTFLQKDLLNYPKATDRTGTVANPITQQSWLYGTGEFLGKGFKNYANNASNLFNIFSENIDYIQNANETIEKNIPLMQDAELKKIADNKSLKQMQERLDSYNSALNNASIIIKSQQNDNQDPVLTFLTDSYLTDYQKFHNDFEQNLNVFKKSLSAASLAMQSVGKKIKRYQRKNKAISEKEKTKSAAF